MGFYRAVDWLRRLDGSPTCTNTIPRNPRIGHRTPKSQGGPRQSKLTPLGPTLERVLLNSGMSGQGGFPRPSESVLLARPSVAVFLGKATATRPKTGGRRDMAHRQGVRGREATRTSGPHDERERHHKPLHRKEPGSFPGVDGAGTAEPRQSTLTIARFGRL